MVNQFIVYLTVSQWVLFEQQEMQLKPNMSPLWRCFDDRRDITKWLLSHWLHSAFTWFKSLFKLAQWWNVFLDTFSVFRIQSHTAPCQASEWHWIHIVFDSVHRSRMPGTYLTVMECDMTARPQGAANECCQTRCTCRCLKSLNMTHGWFLFLCFIV